eukprot:14393036-Alexandrium_andersonii.AAC.1
MPPVLSSEIPRRARNAGPGPIYGAGLNRHAHVTHHARTGLSCAGWRPVPEARRRHEHASCP